MSSGTAMSGDGALPPRAVPTLCSASGAQFLRMDYFPLGGVGSREVGDGWCCQIVDEGENGRLGSAEVG